MAMRKAAFLNGLDHLSRVVTWGMGAGALAWMVWVALHYPALRAEHEARREAELASEDREHCGRLGLGPDRGAEIFAACARELDLVRQRQDQRQQDGSLL